MTSDALFAFPTIDKGDGGDIVARFRQGNLFSRSLDHAGELMPQDYRRLYKGMAFLHRLNICGTDKGVDDSDKNRVLLCGGPG